MAQLTTLFQPIIAIFLVCFTEFIFGLSFYLSCFIRAPPIIRKMTRTCMKIVICKGIAIWSKFIRKSTSSRNLSGNLQIVWIGERIKNWSKFARKWQIVEVLVKICTKIVKLLKFLRKSNFVKKPTNEWKLTENKKNVSISRQIDKWSTSGRNFQG